MKKTLILFIQIVITMVLFGCTINVSIVTTSTTSANGTTISTISTASTTTNNLDYSDFSENHITVVDEQLLMPEITYYVYYYGINCTHCQEIKSSVLGIARDLTVDYLYFVSVTTLSDIADGSGVTRTPTLLKIVNGAVSGHYEGESQIMPVLEGLD